MTMIVVNKLEVIDIERQKSEGGPGFVTDRFLLGNQVTKKTAIVEASQVVSVKQRSQLFYFGWNTGPGGLVEIGRVVVIHLLVFKNQRQSSTNLCVFQGFHD